jgi:hypothetical protein
MNLDNPPQYEEIRVQFVQIACTDTQVHTPVGRYPLAGSTWTVDNQTYTTQSIPGWAIVMAVLFFVICLLGLLFLAIKERRTAGSIKVSVQGQGFSYTDLIPAYDEMAIYRINEQVNWIRAQVARLSQA